MWGLDEGECKKVFISIVCNYFEEIRKESLIYKIVWKW